MILTQKGKDFLRDAIRAHGGGSAFFNKDGDKELEGWYFREMGENDFAFKKNEGKVEFRLFQWQNEFEVVTFMKEKELPMAVEGFRLLEKALTCLFEGEAECFVSPAEAIPEKSQE